MECYSNLEAALVSTVWDRKANRINIHGIIVTSSHPSCVTGISKLLENDCIHITEETPIIVMPESFQLHHESPECLKVLHKHMQQKGIKLAMTNGADSTLSSFGLPTLFQFFSHKKASRLYFYRQLVSDQIQQKGKEVASTDTVLQILDPITKQPSLVLNASCPSYLLPLHLKGKPLIVLQVPDCGRKYSSLPLEKKELLTHSQLEKASQIFALYHLLKLTKGTGLALKSFQHLSDFAMVKHMPELLENIEQLQEKFKQSRPSLTDVVIRVKKSIEDELLNPKPNLEGYKSSFETKIKVKVSQFPDHFLTEYNHLKDVQLLGPFLSQLEYECYKQLRCSMYAYLISCVYQHLHAEIYMISCTTPQRQPDPETIGGIILAAMRQERRCRIVVMTPRSDFQVPNLSWLFNFEENRKLTNTPKVTLWCLSDNEDSRSLIEINPQNPQDHIEGLEEVQLQTSQLTTCHLLSPNLQSVLRSTAPWCYEEKHTLPLHDYLQLVVGEEEFTHTLSSVLKYLIGPKVLSRIRAKFNLADKLHVSLESLFSFPVKKESTLDVTKLKTTALSGKLLLDVPKDAKTAVTKIIFTVENAKTFEFKARLEVFPTRGLNLSFELRDYLQTDDLNGTCGKPLGDYLAMPRLAKPHGFESAKHYLLGEAMSLLLSLPQVESLLNDLPFNLLSGLLNSEIDLALTIIDFNDDIHVKSAHVYLKPPTEPFKLHMGSMCMELQTSELVLDVFPSLISTKRGMQLNGEFVINKHLTVRMTCVQKVNKVPEIRLECTQLPNFKEALKSLGWDLKCDRITVPFLNTPLSQVTISNLVINLQQLTDETMGSGSISFVLALSDPRFLLKQLVPQGFTKLIPADIDAKIAVTVYDPPETTHVGLTATFNLRLSHKSELDGVLHVNPIQLHSGTHYTCIARVRPQFQPYEAVKTVVLQDIVEKLLPSHYINGSLLGSQILNEIELTCLDLQFSDDYSSVKDFTLHAFAEKLDLINGLVSVTNASILVEFHSKKLVHSCEGHVTLLDEYKVFTSFRLPTSQFPGELVLDNVDPNLTLKYIFAKFGWGVPKRSTFPLVSIYQHGRDSVLDVSLTKLHITFGIEKGTTSTHLQQVEVNLNVAQFDLDVIQLSDAFIVMSIDSGTMTSFSASAFLKPASISKDQSQLAEAFHACLQYLSKEETITGRIVATKPGNVTALTTIETFFNVKSNIRNNQTFEDLKRITERLTDTSPESNAGLTKAGHTTEGYGMLTHLTFRIGIKSKSKHVLQKLLFQISDTFQSGRFCMESLQFEYDLNEPIARLLALIHGDKSESMTLDFIMKPGERTSKELTAVVSAGPSGSHFKLQSVFDLAKCALPSLPNIEMPEFLNLELEHGSITFSFFPFTVTAFDVTVGVDQWSLIEDPRIAIKDVKFTTQWKTNSELVIKLGAKLVLGHVVLPLHGLITPNEVKFSAEPPEILAELKTILNELHPPELPGIHVPEALKAPTYLNIQQFLCFLQEKQQDVFFHGYIETKWSSLIGSHSLQMESFGGIVELHPPSSEKQRAMIFSTLKFGKVQVELQMNLIDETSDHVFIGTASCPEDSVNASEIISSTGSTCTVPYYDIVPTTVPTLQLASVAAVVNITQKQILVLGTIHNIGNCTLLLDMSCENVDFFLGIDLSSNFKFSNLSQSLSFVDSVIAIKWASLLVSSSKNCTFVQLRKEFKTLLTYMNKTRVDTTNLEEAAAKEPLDQAIDGIPWSEIDTQHLTYEAPFAQLMSNTCPFSLESFRIGLAIYAAVDLKQTSGLLANIPSLCEDQQDLPNIVLRVLLTRTSFSTGKNEFYAKITSAMLLGHIHFHDITLLYQVSTNEEYLHLTGQVTINYTDTDLCFEGDLHICKAEARLITSVQYDGQLVNPAGLLIALENLELEWVYALNRDSKSGPVVTICGDINLNGLRLKGSLVPQWGNIIKDPMHAILQNPFRLISIHPLNDVKPSTVLSIFGIYNATVLDYIFVILEHYRDKKSVIYYSVEDFEHNAMQYKEGKHVDAYIRLFSMFTFHVQIDCVDQNVTVSGRSPEKINLWIAQLTDFDFKEGPALKYEWKSNTLTLECGIEIFHSPWFKGMLSYDFSKRVLEGSIRCEKDFLWMEKPEIGICWSKDGGFGITKLPMNIPDKVFSLFKALKVCAKWLYDLLPVIVAAGTGPIGAVGVALSTAFKLQIDLGLRIAKNPDPDKYMFAFSLSCELAISLFNKWKLTPLSLNIPWIIRKGAFSDLSFGGLLGELGKNLWENAVNIAKSLWNFIKDKWTKLCDSVKKAVCNAINAIKYIEETYQTVKNCVVEGIEKGFMKLCRLFTPKYGSIYIVDEDGNRLADILVQEGKEYCKEFIQVFGPLVSLMGLARMAKDAHISTKSQLHLLTKNEPIQMTQLTYQSTSSDEEADHDGSELKVSLNSLGKVTEQLLLRLQTLTEEALEVQDINITVLPYSSDTIVVDWQMNKDIKECDQGDINYTVSVTLTLCKESSENQDQCSFEQLETTSHEKIHRPSKDSEEPWPHLKVSDLKQLHQAVCITVGIQASVTMTIHSIRFNNRQDEVTINGKWNYKQYFPLQAPDLSPPDDINITYFSEKQQVNGNFLFEPSAAVILVQFVDKENPTKIVRQETIDCRVENSREFIFTMDVSNISEIDSDGPYKIQALTLKQNGYSSHFGSSEMCISRKPMPKEVSYILHPKTEHMHDDSIKVKWLAQENLIYVFCLEQHFPNGGFQIILLEEIESEYQKEHYVEFHLKKSLENAGVSPGTEINLSTKFWVKGSTEMFPSRSVSSKFTVLASPGNVHCSLSTDGEAEQFGLHVKWQHIRNSVDYIIQVIDTESGTVAVERIHHQCDATFDIYNEPTVEVNKADDTEGGKTRTDDDYNIEGLLHPKLLQEILIKRSDAKIYTTYKLQMYTCGDGTEYCTSLVPSEAPEIIAAFSSKIDYLSDMDKIKVHFTAQQGVTSYTVNILRYNFASYHQTEAEEPSSEDTPQGHGLSWLHNTAKCLISQKVSDRTGEVTLTVDGSKARQDKRAGEAFDAVAWITSSAHVPSTSLSVNTLMIGVSNLSLTVMVAPSFLEAAYRYDPYGIISEIGLHCKPVQTATGYIFRIIQITRDTPVLKLEEEDPETVLKMQSLTAQLESESDKVSTYQFYIAVQTRGGQGQINSNLIKSPAMLQYIHCSSMEMPRIWFTDLSLHLMWQYYIEASSLHFHLSLAKQDVKPAVSELEKILKDETPGE